MGRRFFGAAARSRQSACTKKASPKGGVKDAGASLSVSYRKDYLASALTLRARRDFLRAAQFLWYTWFAAAWSIVLQASVRRDFASSAFPASTASRTRILCVALCVGFHTKDRSFDVRQVIHPLIFRTILEYDSMPPGKKQPLFLAACDFRRCGAGSAAGDARSRLSCHGRGRDDIMEEIFPGRCGGTAAALRTRKTASCIPRGAAGF